MSYKFQMPANKGYILKNKQFENKILFCENTAKGQIDELKFCDGLSLIKSDIIFKEDCNLKLNTNSKNMLFTFLLDGSTKYNSKYSHFDIDAKKDHITVVMDNHSEGIKKYAKNIHLKSVQLILSEEYFNSIIFDEFKDNQLIKRFNKNIDFLECIKFNKIDIQSKINIHEIFNTPLSGSFNKLYLQSKIFDILHSEIKLLLNSNLNDVKNLKFSQYDIDALYAVKDILIQNMQSPPSLIELSKMVKLNEFKLKTGFKKLFKTTPYGFLFEYNTILNINYIFIMI